MGIIYDLKNADLQIDEGIRKAYDLDLPRSLKPSKVFILGIGGSAMAGELLRRAVIKEVDIEVIRGPDLEIAGDNSLIFIVSYSGNTWETLSALSKAMRSEAVKIILTSNGLLEKIAAHNNLPMIKLTEGRQPRADIYEQLFAMLTIMERLGLEINISREALETKRTFSKVKNMEIWIKKTAEALYNKVPIIYGYSSMGAAALRWKQQLNENSKILAWYEELPEALHNSIVGWSNYENLEEFITVFLRDYEHEGKYLSKAIDYFSKKLEELNVNVMTICIEGSTLLSKMLGTSYVGDLVSLELAKLRKVNPEEVKIISELKSYLNKFNILQDIKKLFRITTT